MRRGQSDCGLRLPPPSDGRRRGLRLAQAGFSVCQRCRNRPPPEVSKLAFLIRRCRNRRLAPRAGSNARAQRLDRRERLGGRQSRAVLVPALRGRKRPSAGPRTAGLVARLPTGRSACSPARIRADPCRGGVLAPKGNKESEAAPRQPCVCVLEGGPCIHKQPGTPRPEAPARCPDHPRGRPRRLRD